MGKYRYDEPSKQHLSLSSFAWDVLERDRTSFAVDGKKIALAGLLNRIFLNFYTYAEASLPLRLKEKRREVDEALAAIKTEQRIQATGLLVAAYERELRANIRASGKVAKVGKPFTIQNQTHLLLESLSNEGYFANENGSEITSGKYMAAVFEEYAKKPYCERERVFFHDTVATIRSAIELERALILTQLFPYEKRVRRLILPYSIQTDKLSMYNYLVGCSCKMDNNDDSMKPLGIRLSKIADIKIDESSEPGSGNLSEKMRANIKTSLTNHDAMFITGADKSQNIEVRLTTKGRRYYEQQIHMRPQYSSIIGENADIYVFDCSPRQAEYYFFKFGKEAEILSPTSLRQTFIMMYADAVNAYTPSSIPI
jgi:hypothetical protein